MSPVFPKKYPEDLEATLQLALKSSMAGSANILVQLATILPGTDLYRNCSSILVRQVDTYFSLGIEFDNGRRLAVDDELIDSDPDIFCSFYNVPSPAGSLKDLNDVARYFPVLASLYPRSFLLIALELNRQVRDLFFVFLHFISEQTGTADGALTPANCLLHFESFADHMLAPLLPLTRKFIPDVIRYESTLVRCGGTAPPPTSFQIDINHFHDFTPAINANIFLEEFTFKIPDIILDVQNGAFALTYPEEATYLAFTKREDQVDVKEVNEFGVDFIRLCDGERSLDAIAESLYPRYGAEVSRDRFAELCAEAAAALVDLSWLVPRPPRNQGGERG